MAKKESVDWKKYLILTAFAGGGLGGGAQIKTWISEAWAPYTRINEKRMEQQQETITAIKELHYDIQVIQHLMGNESQIDKAVENVNREVHDEH